jgi:hypothetical protein
MRARSPQVLQLHPAGHPREAAPYGDRNLIQGVATLIIFQEFSILFFTPGTPDFRILPDNLPPDAQAPGHQ